MATSYALACTAQPTTEPVSPEEVCRHCRLSLEDLDTEQLHAAMGYAAAARGLVETRTGLALMPQTFRLRLAGFADVLEIPRPPLQRVVSIKYLDPAGVEQTLPSTGYRVHSDNMPGLITLAPGHSWPAVEDSLLPVSVEYLAGYTSSHVVPAAARQAILLLTSHWYENRAGVVPGTMGEVPLAFDSLVKSLVVGTGWVN